MMGDLVAIRPLSLIRWIVGGGILLKIKDRLIADCQQSSKYNLNCSNPNNIQRDGAGVV